MADHLGRVAAPGMIGVGATFDFLAGIKPQAPPWMQQNRLDWLFRLLYEMRRLRRRNVYIVPSFASLAARELLQHTLRSSAAMMGVLLRDRS